MFANCRSRISVVMLFKINLALLCLYRIDWFVLNSTFDTTLWHKTSYLSYRPQSILASGFCLYKTSVYVLESVLRFFHWFGTVFRALRYSQKLREFFTCSLAQPFDWEKHFVSVPWTIVFRFTGFQLNWDCVFVFSGRLYLETFLRLTFICNFNGWHF